jgi:cytochrome b pre-mRNA-processing protein 3
MILDRLRPKTSAAALATRRLYDGAVAQARARPLYASMGLADTPEGRFEALTLHVLLLLDRLKREGREGALAGQRLFDAYVGDLDGALREMGVGDLAVGGKMKKLGAAFYGRATALEAAFGRLPDRALLGEAIGRTMLEERIGADAAPLASYVCECRAHLSGQSAGDLLAGVASWPAP